MVSKIQELRNTFDAYNIKRVYMAMLNFSDNEEKIFKVIPLLLHCAVDILDCPPTAPHGISFFTPKKIHMDALNHLFPETKHYNTNVNNPSFLSLSLMGSLGTVAQTKRSDFDYIILFDKTRISDKGLRKLNQKLSAIGNWAMDEFNVEVHFFVQDIVDFKENRFGSTDKESIGSAGGKLFKDEFYRTAIFIGGKRPLWWIIPPGLPEHEVEGFKNKLPSLIGDEANQYIDLGHVLHVEPQEFFGAALWQVNKFLDSPYKSLLKIALLESYLLNPEGPLLCEILKHSILESNKEGYIPDSYIMMCEKITEYYVRSSMPENEILVLQAAFLLKTDLSSKAIKKLLTSPPTNLNGKQSVISKILKQWNWSNSDLDILDEINLCRENNYYLSAKIQQLFLTIYKRLTDWLYKTNVTTKTISKEDLTVLGRKLFVFFEKKTGKIPLLLPGQIPKEPLKNITIIYDKLSVKDAKWTLYDFYLFGIESNELRNISSPVLNVLSLIEILAWPVINRFWKPGCGIIFQGKSPFSKQKDIEKIMTELFVFFIGAGIFNPLREDYLSRKRFVKAFVIANLDITNSLNRLSDISLVLLNSWGEYFFKNIKPNQAIIETSDMIIFAKQNKKHFDLQVIAPPSYNNYSNLCKEYQFEVNRLVERKSIEYRMKKKKKVKLDT